jgi:hypothetical protein
MNKQKMETITTTKTYQIHSARCYVNSVELSSALSFKEYWKILFTYKLAIL